MYPKPGQDLMIPDVSHEWPVMSHGGAQIRLILHRLSVEEEDFFLLLNLTDLEWHYQNVLYKLPGNVQWTNIPKNTDEKPKMQLPLQDYTKKNCNRKGMNARFN